MPATSNTIDLSGTWSLKDERGEYACDYAIPGDVHSALLAAGLIPDPYVGRNELAVRGLADRDWVASRTFQWEGEDSGNTWHIDYDFLDAIAEIRINGETVESPSNCFLRYRSFFKPVLKQGENQIDILFKSNPRAATERASKLHYKIPYTVSNCPIPDVNMLRKPQCHFGWDWNLAIAPFGLYGRITLRKAPLRIDYTQVRQSFAADGTARVGILMTIFSDDENEREVNVVVSLGDETRTTVETVPGGHSECYAHLEIANPRRWWPAGQGEQNLYDLTVEVDGQIEHRKIGLRNIEHLTDKDGPGARFAFRVNGREIFMRGANWIPADALPSRATPELTEKLLRAAVDANMNMIRVWGGGFYEQD